VIGEWVAWESIVLACLVWGMVAIAWTVLVFVLSKREKRRLP